MKTPTAPAELLDLSVREFAERLADGRTAAGGGSAAAVVLAISAGLAGMAARRRATPGRAHPGRSRGGRPPCQGGAAGRGGREGVRRGARDAAESRRARPWRAGSGHTPALSRAAEVPLAIAETGYDVAELASTIAEFGSEEVRADAAAAAVLAAAGAQAAADLVVINLAAARADERVALARLLVERSAACARRALGRGA